MVFGFNKGEKKNLVRIQLDNVVKLLDGEMQEQLVIDSRGFTKKRIIITYGGDNETTIGL
jgi:hypothetical protein|tara:strand:- start:1799 stop:1978 length:180 start_codon:yes stop_codon:yes gene_type:complete